MLYRLFLSALLLFSISACASTTPKGETGKQAVSQGQERLVAIQEAQKYAQAGDRAKLLNVLSAADKQYPNDPVILRMLGYALIYNKREGEAVALFDKLIASNPKYALYYADKAMALDYMQRHADAQSFYRQALALAPDNTGIKNNLAMSLILSGQFDEAIGILEPLSKQPNATRKVRQNLALAYGLKGDVKKARKVDLKDLTPEEARENALFYSQYTKDKSGAERTDEDH